jgi:hypothetical protein
VPIYFMDDPNAPIVPAVARSYAHLTVLSETLSAAEMAQIIGIDPDESWERGEKRGGAARFGGISVASRLPREAAPGEHLSDLLSLLAPIADRVRELARDDRILGPRLWIFHHIANQNPGLTLSAEQVSELAQLGTGLELDIYAYEDSSDIPGH